MNSKPFNKQNRGDTCNKYAIPKFSEEFIKSCDNIKLLYEKYIPILQDNNLPCEKAESYKSKVFKQIKEQKTSINILDKVYKEITQEVITLTTKSRLIVGLGSTSILETSIKLHHIYGVPYIPSSSVKGVLRAFNILKAINFNLDEYNDFEKRIEKIEEIKSSSVKENIVKVFGNQHIRGSIVFFDAIPKSFEFEEDIMNVHYKDYYSSDKPPTDTQNPNPIKFLVIKPGASFNFYFQKGAQESYKKMLGNDLEDDIKNASEYLGFGGKTAIGYGVFG